MRFIPTLTEGVWRRAESDMARRERLRLRRNRTIVPMQFMEPQMMVKIDGRWSPAMVVNGQYV